MLKNVKIVLCRVSDAGNIGAVCRVMKNMGLSELRLAAPELTMSDISPNSQIIASRAVHAEDIWENARVFDTLAESVKDCAVVVGTTRRRGQYRKNISMTPRELAGWLNDRPESNIALVFGNERTGLDDSELALCNFASHIPADEAQPSLNLSHAAQVYAYELYQRVENREQRAESIGDFCYDNKQAIAGTVKGSWIPMTQDKINALVSVISDNLEKTGFFKQGRSPHAREEQERFLRDVIARAGLSEKEGGYFKDLLVKAARLGSPGKD